MEIYIQLFWNALYFGLFSAVIATSFSVIYSVSRVIHIAHGAVVLFAGYMFSLFLNLGVGFVLALVFAVLCSATLGVIMNELLYEPLRKRGRLTGTTSLVASLGLLIVLQNILLAIWSSKTIRVHSFFDELERLWVFGVVITPIALTTAIVSILIFIGLWFVIKKTKFGVAVRAVSDREEMAEIIGINAKRVRAKVFFICSAVAGVAGVLAALLFNLEPSKSVFYALDAFSAAIVGGLGSVPGAVIAALGINFVSDAGGFFVASVFDDFFAFILAFVFLLFKPQGLLGKKEQK